MQLLKDIIALFVGLIKIGWDIIKAKDLIPWAGLAATVYAIFKWGHKIIDLLEGKTPKFKK